MKIVQKKLHSKHYRNTFYALSSLLVFLFSFYAYSVNAAVQHVVMREEANREMAELAGRLSALELRYIDLKNQVTVEFAHANGFAEEAEPVFVGRGESAFSFNKEI